MFDKNESLDSGLSWFEKQRRELAKLREERLIRANAHYTQVLSEIGFSDFELGLSHDDNLTTLRFSANDETGFIVVSCHCSGSGDYDGGDVIYFDIPNDCRDILESIKSAERTRQQDYAEHLVYALKGKGFYGIHHDYRIGSPYSRLNIITKKMERKYELQIQKSFADSLGNGKAEETLRIDFDNMEGHQFESFCANLLVKRGYEDVLVTQGSGDQGVDIIAYKDGVKYGIQCKCYSSVVGNKAVQEVFAGKTFYQCHVGIVITNNYFTESAIELAKSNGIILWDRNKLMELIEKVK